jgi:hypothetical protein
LIFQEKRLRKRFSDVLVYILLSPLTSSSHERFLPPD